MNTIKRIPRSRQYVFELALPWLVLIFLILYTYAFFYRIPFPGFNFSTSRAQVTEIHIQDLGRPSLEIGDELIQVGPVRWDDFR
ncbi:MAG: hypothetical protein HY260_18210, partial [Chloroflexi bacterium]|nr:hypothetical protein [Chloroflexota bacterium]